MTDPHVIVSEQLKMKLRVAVAQIPGMTQKRYVSEAVLEKLNRDGV